MPRKLLIADDEDSIRRGVAKYIRLHTDCFDTIYEASTGEEALECILKQRPDIILLDIQMPLKTGVEVMQEITKAGLHPIIVILSGYDEFSYAQQAIKHGARRYLLKPVRASEILECVLAYVNEIEVEDVIRIENEDNNVQQRFVLEAKEYLEEHYSEELTLSIVAKKLGISSGYLSTLLNQYLECGFVEILNKTRVDRACTYLVHNQLKTYEIAYKVGFRDEKYFSKVFKKICGVSPREYRNKAGKV